MRNYVPLILYLPLLVLLPFSVHAQNNGQQNQESNDEQENQVVRIVRFTGNNNVSNTALQTLVRTRNNREFLGIPRFTPWYYIHQLFGVGEEPALLDREVVGNDIDRIEVFYENLGFFDVSVDTTVVEYRENRYEVSFIIDEGPGSSIRNVSYTGLPEFENEETVEQFFEQSTFSGDRLNDSTFVYREPYRAQELRQEQTRIIDFLKNHGYAASQRDSVRALVREDEESPQQLDVLFTIRAGDLYRFGDVHLNLSGPDEQEQFDDSTTVTGPPYTNSGFSIFMRKQNSAQSEFSVLTEQIQFTPGDRFDQSAYLQSINSFQNLGNMVIDRFGLSEESSLPDYSSQEIPVYFDLQTLPRHSLRMEFFGMRRYGFGTGVGANYSNNNLFGRSENLTIGINTNFEFVPSNTLNEIAPRDSLGRRNTTGAEIFENYEIRAEYSVPRLNFPFGFMTDYDFIESARTRYSLTYSQSNQLYFDINSDVRFNLRYEFRHSQRLTSFLDLIELDIVDTTPSSQFRQNLINEFGQGSFELLRIQQDFDPQFSSVIRYTLRNQNTDLIQRDFGYFSEYSLALAGNIPHSIDRFLVTPGTVEGSLPSPFGISSNALSYSRYIKLTADYRRYVPLAPNTVFAFRGFAGIAQPYGGSETIPLNRRFFAGGSNDIRGWNPFRLGPGGISPDEVTIPGGEIKLALFKEFRHIVLSNVLGADWLVAWHTDAGNVWYGPQNTFRNEENVELLNDGRFFLDSFYKQIAVGSGFGLRFDWEYIVARFDLTFRVHDLEEGWFENRAAYFSFGIGHSF
ncbi:BamA/TamA family outer membrane protein [Rhodohalobacter sulfatireducens]|uniref:BamA/TamA family outer membrane protein n=1 Tax=Rhodohalobacter sulfatireducens TaxID=2911366 RepID=A0ABS9KG80_9BACT|nr:BamA/TamA family outer membrane protein [Rhodohalobacter sulfatireducens]